MNTLITSMLVVPLVGALISLVLRKPWQAVASGCLGTIAAVGAGAAALRDIGPQPHGWYCLDSLAAFHLGLLLTVFLFSSIFALFHFRSEAERGELDLRAARRFAALWPVSFAALALVLIASKLGIM